MSASVSTPLPIPPPPRSLRSCLSTLRSGSPVPSLDIPTRPSPLSSRSTSFSSETSYLDDPWRRAKSVRWQGEDEGCAVTSYHSTWSATEYDRTPLEPPSEAERTCVLPERNARSLRISGESYFPIHDDAFCSSPVEDISSEPFDPESPPAEEATEADKEWEECMERRRMMFANMCPGLDRHPEFDGYRSISATLVNLLRSVECDEGRCPSAPVPDEGDDRLPVAVFSRLRETRFAGAETPSLISSAGSEAESGRDSPSRGVSVDGLVITINEGEVIVDENDVTKCDQIREDELETVEL